MNTDDHDTFPTLLDYAWNLGFQAAETATNPYRTPVLAEQWQEGFKAARRNHELLDHDNR